MAVGLSAVNRAWSPLYSLPFSYPTSLMRASDAPWRLTQWDRISRTEIKRMPCMHASPGQGLNNCRLSQALANKQHWHAGPPSDSNRRTSVSVPYSNPMFDVPDVSRFYRCSISDVHIGRSLVLSQFSVGIRVYSDRMITYIAQRLWDLISWDVYLWLSSELRRASGQCYCLCVCIC